MPIAAHDNQAVQPSQDYSVAEIFAIRGINTNDNALSLNTEEMTKLENFVLGPRHIKRRLGSALVGTDPGSITKIIGLGHLEQDSGITLLMMGNNGTLYKYSSGTWSASDKTNYDVTNDANIITFASKDGSSLDNGTSTSGTTVYIIEDSSKSWTPGAYKGKCVVIRGEVKYITDNTATVLFLSDRLNRDLEADYQTQAYAIYAVAPMAFIANGVDFMQKYNLTTTTPLDGTQVSGGEPVPKFRYIIAHQGRLFGLKGLGDENDRAFISDLSIGEQFTKDTNLNINLSFLNDGDEITGGVSLSLHEGSVLLVTKNNSVHSIEGDNVLNYVVHARYSNAGNIAPKTLRASGRTAYMLSFDGVLRFSGDQIESLYRAEDPTLEKSITISLPIDSEIAAFSEAERRAACAEVFDNKYFLGIGSTLYLYDIVQSLNQQQNVWMTLSFPWTFNELHAAGDALYAGSKTTGQVYQLFTGNEDDSARVTATMETSWITGPGAPTMRVARVEVQADGDSDAVMRLAYATDGSSTYSSWITATLDQDLGVYRFVIDERATSFKFKFLDNDTDAPVRIAMPIRIFYSIDSFGTRESKADLV